MERRDEWDEDSDEGPDPDEEMHNTEEAQIFEVRLAFPLPLMKGLLAQAQPTHCTQAVSTP